jgi:hypothetical protein
MNTFSREEFIKEIVFFNQLKDCEARRIYRGLLGSSLGFFNNIFAEFVNFLSTINPNSKEFGFYQSYCKL